MIKNLKYIDGFEEYGNYSITSEGDVVSNCGREDRILKPNCNKYGYLYVSLSLRGISRSIYIAHLVARAFCNGYSPELEVDHINEIKIDNRALNLQYLTSKENSQKSFNKPVVQFTLGGKIVRVWDSMAQAQREGGFTQQTISAVCLGKIKVHAGFNWCFEEDLEDNLGKHTVNYKKRIIQLDEDNDIIKIWESGAEAQNLGGFNADCISRTCHGKQKTHAGYFWEFDLE